MAADGSETAFRHRHGAPAPDAGRIATLSAGLDTSAPETFAEPVRTAAIERIERALAAARTGDLTEATAQLTHARSVLEGLTPGMLDPRRGLAGLFDSRGKRLKRFRLGFHQAMASLADIGQVLGDQIDGAGRRGGALDDLWRDIRDAVVDLDVHLRAAIGRLGDAPDATDAPAALASRRDALDTCRNAALSSLSLIRNAQNADARAAERLQACRSGIEAWRDDWKDALGLAGKRIKRVRPDTVRLARTRDDLLTRIDKALAEMTHAKGRQSAVANRLQDLRRPL